MIVKNNEELTRFVDKIIGLLEYQQKILIELEKRLSQLENRTIETIWE